MCLCVCVRLCASVYVCAYVFVCLSFYFPIVSETRIDLSLSLLCRSYTLDQLEELFSSYGQIVQKNLLKDKVTGLPRGVGFVR